MSGDISLPDVSKLNDLQDDQIEALIEKLAEVQAHAPQIIAALEAQQEARSRGSGSKGEKSHRNNNSLRGNERTQPPKGSAARRHHSPQPPQRRESHNDFIEEEEEEEDDDDDDEEDDDFDEDAEYPMVGDGYSDELSVVSDMTTPTVVSSMEVNDEEFYRDMVIGGMKVAAPKKRDLLSQVAKTNARKAAPVVNKKKPMANDAAVKKPARVASNYSSRPEKAVAATKPEAVKPVKKKKTKDGASVSSGDGAKKVKKKVSAKKKPPSPHNSGSGWVVPNGAAGPSTSGTKKKVPQEKKAGPVMIDDDGFLVDQSTFESFDANNNPFASAAPPSFDAPDGGEDAFGGFDTFGAPAPSQQPSKSKASTKKTTKPKKLNVSSTGKKKKSSSASTSGSSPTSKRKGTRRASVGM